MGFFSRFYFWLLDGKSVKSLEWHHAQDSLPRDGQEVYYFGPDIGIWVGRYKYAPNDRFSHHLFVSNFGVVDRMDAPYWRPFNKKHHRLGFIPLPPKEFLSKELNDD